VFLPSVGLRLLRSASALPLVSSLYAAIPLAMGGVALLPATAFACTVSEPGSGNINCYLDSASFSGVSISTQNGYYTGIGVYGQTSTIGIDGGSIRTTGDGAAGIVSQNSSFTGRGLSIVTEGGCTFGSCYGDVPNDYPAAFGAAVWDAGSILLEDSSITTRGEWGGGLVVMGGAWANTVTSAITATNVDVLTQGENAAAIMGYNSTYMPVSTQSFYDPVTETDSVVATRNLATSSPARQAGSLFRAVASLRSKATSSGAMAPI